VIGGQVYWEAKWTPQFETMLGLAAFYVGNDNDLSAKVQPFYNSGNSRNVDGFLTQNYSPIIGNASATYRLDSFPGYVGKFPIKVSGEYLDNPAAASNNRAYRAGVTLGKSGKKQTWEVSYRYQRLEADAWYDALVDDDNGAFYGVGNPRLFGTGKTSGWFGGTNVKGHQIQGVYSFTDFFNFTFTYYMNDLIVGAPGTSARGDHFMADLNWKF